MRKMRVMFVLPQLDAGGSERVVFDLARALDSDNFEVFAFAFKSGMLAEHLKDICKEIFIVKKQQGLDLSAMMKLAQTVKKYQIDVVNAHHYMPCFYSFLGTRVLNGIKLVYTEHSVAEVESLANSIHNKIFHCMLYGIDEVIGVSRAITEKFKEKYPRHAGKFHEVLNGVDIDKFQAKGARERVRKKWGLDMEHFVVGTVANFRRVKNHVCLVRAASRLKISHPQLRLLFVGTGFPGDAENSLNEVLDVVHEYGLEDRIVFAGYQENIPEMLSSFDMFCLPSKSEGLPVCVLEAMAAGLLVVGSNVSGIVEVIKNGRTGILFSSDNDAELSITMKRIIDNPEIAKSMAHNGFLFVNDAHNYKSWQNNYSRILARSELAI